METQLAPLQFPLVLLVGCGLGFLAGLFGVGGGFLVVPVLNIVLRIPIELAVGAGACQGLGPATTALLTRRVAMTQVRLPLTIIGGLLTGVVSGASLLEQAGGYNDWKFSSGRTIPAADLLVLVVYECLLVGVGLFVLYESRRERRTPMFAGFRRLTSMIPPTAEFEEFDNQPMSIAVLAWFGLLVGFLSGLLGIGGGFILLPGMIYLLGMRTHQAILSSLIIVWLVAFQSTVAHAWHENIQLSIVMALLLGGTVGARLGTELSFKLGSRQLRHSFAWLLLGTAALIAGRLGNALFG